MEAPTKETYEYYMKISSELAKVDYTDSDKDGLPDIFETVGIMMSNGQIINTIVGEKDTDKDGRIDGREISYSTFDYSAHNVTNIGTSVRFITHSNPLAADGDDDGIPDVYDIHPLKAGGNEDKAKNAESYCFTAVKSFKNYNYLYVSTKNLGNIYALPTVKSDLSIKLGNFNKNDSLRLSLEKIIPV